MTVMVARTVMMPSVSASAFWPLVPPRMPVRISPTVRMTIRT